MPVDRAVHIRAFLILAKSRGRAWLASEQERVALAVLGGAKVIKSLSVESRTMSGDNEISAPDLLNILTEALEQFDADAAGTSTDNGGCVIIPRFSRISY